MNDVRGVKKFSPAAQDELNKLKDRLEVWTCRFLGVPWESFEGLSKLHKYLTEDNLDEFHYSISRFVWSDGGLFDLALREKDTWIELFNGDIDVQAYPHVRISRPDCASDNVGFHRDTDYGASAYEVSVWIPFDDVPHGAGMWTFGTAEREPLRNFDFLKRETEHLRGSKKNIAGAPYRLNNVILTDAERALMVHNSMRFGEYLFIPLGGIHGSEINSSNLTRVSVDMRLVSSRAVDETSTLHRRRTEPMGDGRGTYYRQLVGGSETL